MRHISFRLIAASLALAMLAGAATRPQYGGTLQVEVSKAIPTVVPVEVAKSAQPDAIAIAKLVYENLTVLDSSGTPQPALALDWQHDAMLKKWQFQLRPGVQFHDGEPLTALSVAESLRQSGFESVARVAASGDSIFFESDSSLAKLPAMLSQIQYAIVKKTNSAETVGTGPFKLASKAGAQHITLLANDGYWAGRPYLDGVEISLQVPARQQLVDQELGRVDVTEIGVEDVRRAENEDINLVRSQPATLLALIFDPTRNAAKTENLRPTIASSIDRASIWSVLLEKQGAPSAALLPQWISGYEFLFSAGNSPIAPAPGAKPSNLILEYDYADPVLKSVAERIAVNARDSGISIQAVGEVLQSANGRADIYLIRVPISSGDAAIALKQVLDEISNFEPALKFDESPLQQETPEQLYGFEKAVLAEGMVIPLAHIPEIYGLNGRVHDWMQPSAAGWPLADVWVRGAAASGDGGRLR